MRRLLELSALALLALMLIACSGDDDDDDGGDATSTATSTADDGGDANGSSSDDDGSSSDGDGSSDDGDSSSDDGDGDVDFEELLRRFEGSEFRVRYEMTADVGGEPFEGFMTWYRAQDGRLRFDIESEQAGQEFNMTSIVTDEGSYLCTGLLGADACFELGSDGLLSIPDPSESIRTQIDRIEQLEGVGATSRREINGIDATCVEVDDAGEVGEACVSDAGVLLLVDLEGPQGRTHMEFVDFSDEVSDDDFEPPFPVQGFPGG